MIERVINFRYDVFRPIFRETICSFFAGSRIFFLHVYCLILFKVKTITVKSSIFFFPFFSNVRVWNIQVKAISQRFPVVLLYWQSVD